MLKVLKYTLTNMRIISGKINVITQHEHTLSNTDVVLAYGVLHELLPL